MPTELINEIQRFNETISIMDQSYNSEVDSFRLKIQRLPMGRLEGGHLAVIVNFYLKVIRNFETEIENMAENKHSHTSAAIHNMAYELAEKLDYYFDRLRILYSEATRYLKHPLNTYRPPQFEMYKSPVLRKYELYKAIAQSREYPNIPGEERLTSQSSVLHLLPEVMPKHLHREYTQPLLEQDQRVIIAPQDITPYTPTERPNNLRELLNLCKKFSSYCDQKYVYKNVTLANYHLHATLLIKTYLDLSHAFRALINKEEDREPFKFLSEIYEAFEDAGLKADHKQAQGLRPNNGKDYQQFQLLFKKEPISATARSLFYIRFDLVDYITQKSKTSLSSKTIMDADVEMTAEKAFSSTRATTDDLATLVSIIKANLPRSVDQIILENPGIGFKHLKNAPTNTEHNFTPLFYAAKYTKSKALISSFLHAYNSTERTQAVKVPLKSDINPFAGYNLVMIAAYFGHHLVLEELIQICSKTERKKVANTAVKVKGDSHGYTPLLLACAAVFANEEEKVNIINKIKILLNPELEVDVNAQAKNSQQSNALACAASTGNIEAIELLLAHGARVELPYVDYEKAVSQNTQSNENKAAIRRLLTLAPDSSPANTNGQDAEFTALMQLLSDQGVCGNKVVEAVQLLSVNPELLWQTSATFLRTGNDYGLTPFTAAILYSPASVVNSLLLFCSEKKKLQLINQEIIFDNRNKYHGCNALALAIMENRLSAIVLLLKHGAVPILPNRLDSAFQNALANIDKPDIQSKLQIYKKVPAQQGGSAAASSSSSAAATSGSTAAPAGEAYLPHFQEVAFRNRVSLFTHHEKTQEDIHSKAALLLKEHLKTIGYSLGEAYSEGDCFFDGMAQALDLAKIDYPSDPVYTNIPGYKKLRLLCNQEAQRLAKIEGNWLKPLIESDLPGSYQNYLATVQFTAPEMESLKTNRNLFSGIAVWGRQNIEGRLICSALSIRLHIIEIMVVEGEAVLSHQLEDGSSTKQLDEEQAKELYKDNKVVHMVLYQKSLHFVPLIKLSSPALESSSSAAPIIPSHLNWPPQFNLLTIEHITKLANIYLKTYKEVLLDIFTFEPMYDPVILAETGGVYNREGLMKWLTTQPPTKMCCPNLIKIKDKTTTPCQVSRQLLQILGLPLSRLTNEDESVSFPEQITKDELQEKIIASGWTSKTMPIFSLLNKAAIKARNVASSEFCKDIITNRDSVKAICLIYTELTGKSWPGTNVVPRAASDNAMRERSDPSLFKALERIANHYNVKEITKKIVSQLSEQVVAELAATLFEFHQAVYPLLFRSNLLTHQSEAMSDPVRLPDGSVQERAHVRTPEASALPSCFATIALLGLYGYKTQRAQPLLPKIITAKQIKKIAQELGLSKEEFCIELSRIRRASVENNKLFSEGTENPKNLAAIYTLCECRNKKDFFYALLYVERARGTRSSFGVNRNTLFANAKLPAVAASATYEATRSAIKTGLEVIDLISEKSDQIARDMKDEPKSVPATESAGNPYEIISKKSKRREEENSASSESPPTKKPNTTVNVFNIRIPPYTSVRISSGEAASFQLETSASPTASWPRSSLPTTPLPSHLGVTSIPPHSGEMSGDWVGRLSEFQPRSPLSPLSPFFNSPRGDELLANPNLTNQFPFFSAGETSMSDEQLNRELFGPSAPVDFK